MAIIHSLIQHTFIQQTFTMHQKMFDVLGIHLGAKYTKIPAYYLSISVEDGQLKIIYA